MHNQSEISRMFIGIEGLCKKTDKSPSMSLTATDANRRIFKRTCNKTNSEVIMNAIVETTEPRTTSIQLPEETESLIKASIAENTLKAYQRALQSLTNWLSGEPSPMHF